MIKKVIEELLYIILLKKLRVKKGGFLGNVLDPLMKAGLPLKKNVLTSVL